MERRKQLRRTGPPARKTALRSTSPKSTGKRSAPKSSRSHGFPPAVRLAALERDRYTCQAAHVWPEIRCMGGLHVHHVRVKGYRGAPDNSLANALSLCLVHHEHAHNVDRAGAERAGIIVRSLTG